MYDSFLQFECPKDSAQDHDGGSFSVVRNAKRPNDVGFQRRYGLSRSMTMVIPSTPGFTG